MYLHVLVLSRGVSLGEGPDDVAIGLPVTVVGRYWGQSHYQR